MFFFVDNMPHAIWVWDSLRLSLSSLLLQTESIKVVSWDPVHTRFAAATSTNKLYLWAPEGCSIVDIPQLTLQNDNNNNNNGSNSSRLSNNSGGNASAGVFLVRELTWNHDGTALILMDKSK